MKPQSLPITLGMVVQDEAQLLPDCLEAIRSWVQELVVVDTGSQDQTAKLAKQLGARLLRHRWQGDFAKARNVYLEAASCPWILVLDAPERIDARDLPRLARLVRSNRNTAYRFVIRNYTNTFNLLSGWYPNRGEYAEQEKASQSWGWFSSSATRLFQRSKKIRYQGFRHATVEQSVRQAGISIRTARMPIHDVEGLKGDRWIRAKQRGRLHWVEEALEDSPNQFETLLDVAKGLFCLKRDDARAIQLIQKALKLKPRSRQALQLLGMLYLDQGQWGLAQEVLGRAVRVAPGNADLLCLLGMAQLCGGQLQDSKALFRRGFQVREDHPMLWNGLGCLHEAQGEYQQARQAYQRAAQLHPGFLEAQQNEAALRRRLNGNLISGGKLHG